MDDCKRGLEELKGIFEQDDFDEFMKKKSEKEMRDIIGDNYNRTCPHCGRCPTCGRLLWPTPHGPQPCHPQWERKPGVYTDNMGLFIAID